MNSWQTYKLFNNRDFSVKREGYNIEMQVGRRNKTKYSPKKLKNFVLVVFLIKKNLFKYTRVLT